MTLKAVAYILFGGGLFVLVNGAIAFYSRYNFITLERYGPSLEPIYIVFSGIGVLVVGMILKTIADTLSRSRRGR